MTASQWNCTSYCCVTHSELGMQRSISVAVDELVELFSCRHSAALVTINSLFNCQFYNRWTEVRNSQQPRLHSQLRSQFATEPWCCKVQQYVSCDTYISYVPSNFKENVLCYLYWGGEKTKTRFIFREHLLLELNDWTTVFPFHLISTVLLLGPLIWTLVCTLWGFKATDEVFD